MLAVAAETFSMALRHKMTGTWRARGLDEELPVGTNRLKAVMLNDQPSAGKAAQDERNESGTSHMQDIGLSNEPPKLKEARLTDYRKGKFTIVRASSRSLCDQGDFEFSRAVRAAAFGKAARE
jgi:hypothetical protein